MTTAMRRQSPPKDQPINKCHLSLRESIATFAERKVTNPELILWPILAKQRLCGLLPLGRRGGITGLLEFCLRAAARALRDW